MIKIYIFQIDAVTKDNLPFANPHKVEAVSEEVARRWLLNWVYEMFSGTVKSIKLLSVEEKEVSELDFLEFD
jgi:hypothetical protein